jgi:hypothetical protein
MTRLPCSRPIPPRENGLKSPVSVSAQSVIAATWRDLLTNLLTDGPERECCRCVVPGGAEGI